MTDNYIATPDRTKQILKKYGLSMKKSLGQNFLVEPSILTEMLEAGKIDKNTVVIEIGPGIGALTECLAQAAKKVVAFEIDRRLERILKKELAAYDNIEFIFQDILQVDLEAVFAEHFEPTDRIVVAANLPYYITTPIIMNFIEANLPVDAYVMMMQKEVAERMTASPSSKDYGSLTIAIDYYTEAEIAFIVPRTVFIPQPNVDSAVLYLKRRETPKVSVDDEVFYFKLTRGSFQQRRKTLWNNLMAMFGKADEIKEVLRNALEVTHIEPSRRAETLSIEEFANLANELNKYSILEQN
ncbi:Ribosomal RNA small subunit methyltransferase A [Jeotgalibaca dankookensis]|uniref:Ribosomal RNA small subunit methyltransferase A n=1 Tax=Jeotgalibaca dankookensis TaxID=708126 RepID=A0A1S6IQQ6_9LACT|nr:16S rRNA (adenine(1518)-N(6)/adenine(1519)-N(6))-dimethyltransferase RsmA [Jeotgalibaca dankookensis]AQS53864.1 Ribosomal RNA small subunit methyltransferase A [Jeotgalibaca dankookensis]